MAKRYLRLPTWVTLPQAVVEAVEHTMLQWAVGTGAPGAMASWCALQWVGGVDGAVTPLTNVARPATWARASAEFEVAAGIADNDSYPGPARFADLGLDGNEAPAAGWWNAYRCTYGRASGLGTAVALGWVMGVMDGPTALVPFIYKDCSEIPAKVRQEWMDLLIGRVDATRPLQGPGGPATRPA